MVVLGLNSGTSADGLDLAAIRFSGSGRQARWTYLYGREKKYPAAMRRAVLEVISSRQVSPDQLIELDQALGRFYGKTAATFIKWLKGRKINVDAVASHGQTVCHHPVKTKYGSGRMGGSMQLGSLERIATETGKTVVGDFRQADIALGHEGAPITVAAMEELFGNSKEPRLIVNIGGIANYFYFPSKRSKLTTRASDCGPGNSLTDLLATRLFDTPFDKGGILASKGKVSGRLMSLLESHPFLRGATTSTGREEFGHDLVGGILDFGDRFSLTGEDLLATVSEFTVRCIKSRIAPVIGQDKSVDKLYLTGGGERNKFFRTCLSDQLPELSICSVAELGVPTGLVEASAYAVMGKAALCSRPLKTQFGNRKRQRILPVMGRIAQPPVVA